MSKLIDLTGQRFGVLTIINRAENSNSGKPKWLCRCECGNTKTLCRTHLTIHKNEKCTCNRHMHGLSRTRLYYIWQGMIRRCHNPNAKDYRHYGARGISVCNEWKEDFTIFRAWAFDNGYGDELSIDRIDGDGNYEPSNCRWATKGVQTTNRKTSVIIEHDGKTMCLKELAETIKVPYSTVRGKYRNGITIDEIVSYAKQQKT